MLLWASALIVCSNLFVPSAGGRTDSQLPPGKLHWSQENVHVCTSDAKSKQGAVLLGTRKDFQRTVAIPKEANHPALVPTTTHPELIHKNSSCWLTGGPGGIGCWFTWLTSRGSSTSAPSAIEATTGKVAPDTTLETERVLYTFLVRILFTMKTQCGAWLWRCFLMTRAKLNEPMCRFLLLAVVVASTCLWCAMKSFASRQRRSRLHQAKSQLDDDALGYLFKARQLEQARLQAQAQQKGSPNATNKSHSFIYWSK